jgi:hypothetical protein
MKPKSSVARPLLLTGNLEAARIGDRSWPARVRPSAAARSFAALIEMALFHRGYGGSFGEDDP